MGVISDQARSPGDVMRRLADLERAVTQLRNARVLENAAVGEGGLRVHSGGSVRIQDGGHLDVSGDADFSGDTSIGGDLDVSGDAEFSGDTTIGGNAAITGTLSLPAGIIDNEALANPVAFDSGFDNASEFPLGTSDDIQCSFQLVVPGGFTRALVSAAAYMQVVNTEGGIKFARARIYVRHPDQIDNYSSLISVPIDPDSGGQAASSVGVSADIAATPGQPITVELVVSSSSGIPAKANTHAFLNASVLYGR